MGYRKLYIKNASKLFLHDNNLGIAKEDGSELFFPLEDLDLIFLEYPNAIVTTRLLSELKQFGVSIVFCGNDFKPASMVIPITGHYLQSEMLDLQLKLLPSKKNKLWETIIKQKIANQMVVLKNTVNNPDTFEFLKKCSQEVKFGDEKNMEGIAARKYFKTLFGEDFIRFSESPISAALNYGYSVFTSSLIRTVAFNGLNDVLGIWHASKKNGNNLSCDFVEPFRPVVDYYVYSNISSLALPLPTFIRQGMVNLLNEQMVVRGKKYQVSYAMSILVNDFVQYMRSGDITVVGMPKLEFETDAV